LGRNVVTRSTQQPVIAAINGVCLGGGLELAMACHMRICGDRVRLGQPEINLGIIPGWGGTQRLQRIVGAAKATEMILTGDQITAQQAMQLRLVNMVVPGGEVMRQAKGLAAKIATRAPIGTAVGADSHPRRLDACCQKAEPPSVNSSPGSSPATMRARHHGVPGEARGEFRDK
jgi:enoyl-CoA hydratase/carnithine racemase